jgi:AsmA protein
MDLMALFLAGPYGAVFSKGMDFEQLITGDPDDQTPVRRMSSTWKIKDGMASAEDVAINTGRYRLAVTGSLDMTRDQFNNLEVAILNREGCAAFGQVLSGSFDNPTTKGMLNLGLINNPTGDLAKILARPAQVSCEPVYSGSIKHPVMK